MARLTPPKIQNETKLDGREVAGIVRWVFRFLDVDGAGVMVKVKRTSRACGGRFYPHPHESGGHIWKEAYRGAGYGDYVAVGPQVPPEIKRLIVARVGDPEMYPRTYKPYDRRDSPGEWELGDWREALVTVTAHEAAHLRQMRTRSKGRGRFNEVDTEWAAFRAWREWRKEQARA